MPDSLCGELADRHVVPHFKRQDYAGGIKEGASALASIILSDPAAARGDPNSGPVLARTARARAIFANYAVASAAIVLFIIGTIVVWKTPLFDGRIHSSFGDYRSIVAIAAYLFGGLRVPSSFLVGSEVRPPPPLPDGVSTS